MPQCWENNSHQLDHSHLYRDRSTSLGGYGTLRSICDTTGKRPFIFSWFCIKELILSFDLYWVSSDSFSSFFIAFNFSLFLGYSKIDSLFLWLYFWVYFSSTDYKSGNCNGVCFLCTALFLAIGAEKANLGKWREACWHMFWMCAQHLCSTVAATCKFFYSI